MSSMGLMVEERVPGYSGGRGSPLDLVDGKIR